MMLSLALPQVVDASDLTDPALPPEYVKLVLTLGPGVVCNAWRILLPKDVRAVNGTVIFARTLQGDDYGVDAAGQVWQQDPGQTPALVSPSIKEWIQSWLDGSAHESVRTPWFAPDSARWNRSIVHAVTGGQPQAVIEQLIPSLDDCVLLSWIQGPVSVQAHLWWQAPLGAEPQDRVARSNAWICATAVTAETTRADWDLSLDIRTEGDAETVRTEAETAVRASGWLIT